MIYVFDNEFLKYLLLSYVGIKEFVLLVEKIFYLIIDNDMKVILKEIGFKLIYLN